MSGMLIGHDLICNPELVRCFEIVYPQQCVVSGTVESKSSLPGESTVRLLAGVHVEHVGFFGTLGADDGERARWATSL